jgi:acyl-CoA synthetase (AMP-forming)/AMP-acid ligase II
VPRPNAAIDEEELREWIAGRIEKFKWPDVYHFGAELPAGRTGKVDRNALREQVARAGSTAAG